MASSCHPVRVDWCGEQDHRHDNLKSCVLFCGFEKPWNRLEACLHHLYQVDDAKSWWLKGEVDAERELGTSGPWWLIEG